MQYMSTRNSSIKVKSAAAIKKGLSEEGGLFVPVTIPQLTLDDISKLAKKNYIERAVFVLKKYFSAFYNGVFG